MDEMNNNVPTPGKGASIAALVCGIIGVVGGFVSIGWFAIVALVLALLGIILGSKGMKNAKASGQGKGLAVAGLVLGIIGTVFAGIGTICTLVCAAAVSSASSLL